MPSTSDFIGAALQSALKPKSFNSFKDQNGTKLEDQLLASSHQVLLHKIEYDSVGQQQSVMLGSLKSKYIALSAGRVSPINGVSPAGSSAKISPNGKSLLRKDEQLDEPRRVLWAQEKVTLGWNDRLPRGPRVGMRNLGNSCYMNSSLQALFHIPAFANWLFEEMSIHRDRCRKNVTSASYCSLCAVVDTFAATQQANGQAIAPVAIHNKLKCLGRTLSHGGQEDAHEFIKLLLDHMEKSYLIFCQATKLDHRSKETTPLNQIFGGYIRQQVKCPGCGHISTTFSHFQDLVLDIRNVTSVEDALALHFRKETLDENNAYRCDKCRKKVSATKYHLIERAPCVLLIQLKRFTPTGGKIGKHVRIPRFIDVSRYVWVPPTGMGGTCGVSRGHKYRLASMVIHSGSQNFGHYTAIAEIPNGHRLQFDDDMVRPMAGNTDLAENPYLLFYERLSHPMSQPMSCPTADIHGTPGKAAAEPNKSGVLVNRNGCTPSLFMGQVSRDELGEVVARNKSFPVMPHVLTNTIPRVGDRGKLMIHFKNNNKTSSLIRMKPNFNSILPFARVPAAKTNCLSKNDSSSTKKANGSNGLVPYESDSDSLSDSEGGNSQLNLSGINAVNSGKLNNAVNCVFKNKLMNESPESHCKTTSVSGSFVNTKLSVASGNSSTVTNGIDINGSSSCSGIKSNESPSKLKSFTNGNEQKFEKLESGMTAIDDSHHLPTNDNLNAINIESNGFTKNKKVALEKQTDSCKEWSTGNVKHLSEKSQSMKLSDSLLKPGSKNPDFDLMSISDPNNSVDSLPKSSESKIPSSVMCKLKSMKSDSFFKSEKKSMCACAKSASNNDNDIVKSSESDSGSVKSKSDSEQSLKSLKKSMISLFSCVSHSVVSREDSLKINGKQINLEKGIKEENNCKEKRSRKDPEMETVIPEEPPSSPFKKIRQENKFSTEKNCNFVTGRKNFDYNCSKNDSREESEQSHKHRKNKKKRKKKHRKEEGHSPSALSFSLDGPGSSASESCLPLLINSTGNFCRPTIMAISPCPASKTKNNSQHSCPTVVIPWSRNLKDLSHRGQLREEELLKTGHSDITVLAGMKSSQVVDELRMKGNLALGTSVNKWDGGRSAFDEIHEKEKREAKKRSLDDEYNEDIDQGKTKKSKKNNWQDSDVNGWKTHGVSNQFQRVQEQRNSGHNASHYGYRGSSHKNQSYNREDYSSHHSNHFNSRGNKSSNYYHGGQKWNGGHQRKFSSNHRKSKHYRWD